MNTGADRLPPVSIRKPDAGAASGEGLRRFFAVALILAVRLAALNADPPPWLSWSTGPYTDEGFYTLDARHEVLLGTWAPGNFHDRLLSPLLSLLQQGLFSLFGPNLVVARLLSVAFSLLTLIVFWLGLRRVWGVPVANSGTVFLGLAPPFVFYNRLALQETPTVFWLVLAFTLWAYAGRDGRPGRRAWLLTLSGAAFALAVVFKPLALVALPAFAYAWWQAAASRLGGGSPPSPAAQERVIDEGRTSRDRPLPLSGWPVRVGEGRVLSRGRGLLGFGIVLTLYALLWYVPHHAELGRMATFYRVHQMQPHSWGSVGLNLRRGFLGGERGVVPYLLALMPVPCLLAGWGGRRRTDAATMLLRLWLVSGLIFCLLSSYAPSRYYILFLPPLSALAARGMGNIGRAWQAATVVLFVVTCGLWYASAWTHRSYSRRDAAQTLARTIPAGSVMVGEFAPALCLDTKIMAAPVQPGLSNDADPVGRLRADAVAVTRAPVWQRWWQLRYPNIVQPSHRLFTVTLGGPRNYVVDVYSVQPRKP